LRIRFYNSDGARQVMLQALLMATLEPLLNSGLIDKLQVDTYSRELERYGPALIGEAEDLFHNDSMAVLRLLGLLSDCGEERYRLLLALRGTDMLLDDFGLSTGDKQGLMTQLAADFFRESGGGARLRKGLNEQYRQRQAAIFGHLDPASDERNDIEDA